MSHSTKRALATPLAIGIDLGGTHALAVLMSRDGSIHARHRATISADMRSSIDGVCSVLANCILAVWRVAYENLAESQPIQGIGIAIPGNVDPDKGCTRYLPNFGWLTPVDLAKHVLGCPVEGEAAATTLGAKIGISRLHMRNDGRCAALAERHYGVCKPCKGSSGGAAKSVGSDSVVAMLTLGTGIGGAVVHDRPDGKGVLFDGCSCDAGDFGHHVIRSGSDAFKCVCGNYGCFECHASAAGLVRHYRAAGGAEASASLDEARLVVEAMRAGEPVATAAFAKYKADLATGLANLVTFYNPSLIILGGGLSRTPELYDGLQAAVDGATLPATRGLVRIVQGALDADCAAIGAASLVFSETAPVEAVEEERAAKAARTATAAAADSGGDDGRGSIVCLGLTCMDSTMWLSSSGLPDLDTKAVAARSLSGGGGNAANSAIAASRLRAPTHPRVRLVTKLGGDTRGEALLAELVGEDLETTHAIRDTTGGATPTSVILVTRDGQRTIVHDPGLMASAPLLPSEVGGGGGGGGEEEAPAWLRGASLLHLDGRHPAAALHACKCARQAQVPILMDCERPREGLEELLLEVDYVVSASDFPRKLAGDALDPNAPPEVMAQYLLGRCPKARWVCLTMGEKGALLLPRASAAATSGKASEDLASRVLTVPAWPLGADGAKDTTGAGDAFIGAVCVGLRRGLGLEDVLRLAAFTAAANCGGEGARGGMPRFADLPDDLRSLLAN